MKVIVPEKVITSNNNTICLWTNVIIIERAKSPAFLAHRSYSQMFSFTNGQDHGNRYEIENVVPKLEITYSIEARSPNNLCMRKELR